MKSREENRVTFYSKDDMSWTMNLSDAEPILRNFNSNNIYELNVSVDDGNYY